MSAFDEILYGAKKCFDTAAEKTNEFVEASKVRMEKAQLIGEIREEYEHLGKVCYQTSETGVDQTDKMKVIIAKIHALRQELQQADENAKTGKVKVCEHCGVSNSYKFEFCSSCGTKLK